MSTKLDAKKIEHFKEMLEAEKAILSVELPKIALWNPEINEWEAQPAEAVTESDENDLADRSEEYEERTGKVRSLGKKFTDVTLALEKIENGTYGTCELSGEPIEVERLEANPAARTCMAHMNTK